jgi:hypothetical protein
MTETVARPLNRPTRPQSLHPSGPHPAGIDAASMMYVALSALIVYFGL